VQYNSV